MRFKFPIVDKYLMGEFLRPFCFSVFAITVLLISNHLFQLTDLILVNQVEFIRVAKLLLYKIPEIMVESFAVSILFATLLSLTQLVKNNELTAFRMGGVSFPRLLVPFLVTAVIISGLTFFINEEVVPWANHQSENIVRRIILQETLPELQEQAFFEGVEAERHFYIGEIIDETGELKDVMVYEIEGDEAEQFPRMITASGGYFEEEVWHLVDGMVHEFNQAGEVVYQSSFSDMEIDVQDDLENFYGEQRSTSEMSRDELRENIELFRDSGLEVNSLLVDYHLKAARPWASFIFVLLGAPLSIKSDKGRTFGIIASVLIIFAYYVVLSFSRSLGRRGVLEPLLAAWLPNGLFGLIGIGLLITEEYFSFG